MVSFKNLKNKPLIEAILEVKWALDLRPGNLLVDPNYKILLGRFFDRVSEDYPESEELPSASLPDEITGYVVKHRFRFGKNMWPLIQLGPGVMTLNETEKYTWPDFQQRAISAVKWLYVAHPKPDELKLSSLMLRYIDAIELDYFDENILLFLKEKMGISASVPDTLFQGQDIDAKPTHFRWESSFKTIKPSAIVTLKIATGAKKDKRALVWETIVSSEDVPTVSPDAFTSWIEYAHEITHDWFFKIIAGDLERKFSE